MGTNLGRGKLPRLTRLWLPSQRSLCCPWLCFQPLFWRWGIQDLQTERPAGTPRSAHGEAARGPLSLPRARPPPLSDSKGAQGLLSVTIADMGGDGKINDLPPPNLFTRLQALSLLAPS